MFSMGSTKIQPPTTFWYYLERKNALDNKKLLVENSWKIYKNCSEKVLTLAFFRVIIEVAFE